MITNTTNNTRIPNNGEKLVAIKAVTGIFDEGDIIEVINVNDEGIVSFGWGENFEFLGMMTVSECNEYFRPYEEGDENNSPRVKFERIKWIMENADFNVQTLFDKSTVVTCKCPNGFVITESSACVSPENYDEEVGIQKCIEKIENKLWELEGYLLQEILTGGVCCCDGCDCDNEDCEDEYNYDEEEPNCEECEDYECPSNPKHFS